MGTRCLAKVNTSPRSADRPRKRYITGPDASNYTIQADLKSISVRNRLGDMGLVNCALHDRACRRGRPVVAQARCPRPVVGRPPPDRSGGRLRLGVRRLVAGETRRRAEGEDRARSRQGVEEGRGRAREVARRLRGPEPQPLAAAALYGYVYNVVSSDEESTDTLPGSEIYYDNLTITPNGAK